MKEVVPVGIGKFLLRPISLLLDILHCIFLTYWPTILLTTFPWVLGTPRSYTNARLMWIGHVKRRDQCYIGRHSLDKVPSGRKKMRRRRGRPNQILMDCVNRDLRTSGTTEEGWIEENIYHSDPTIKTNLKAPLHDAIRPHGACRLPCTLVNRNV